MRARDIGNSRGVWGADTRRDAEAAHHGAEGVDVLYWDVKIQLVLDWLVVSGCRVAVVEEPQLPTIVCPRLSTTFRERTDDPLAFPNRQIRNALRISGVRLDLGPA